MLLAFLLACPLSRQVPRTSQVYLVPQPSVILPRSCVLLRTRVRKVTQALTSANSKPYSPAYYPLNKSDSMSFLLLRFKCRRFLPAPPLIRWATWAALFKQSDQETWNLSTRLDNSLLRLSEAHLPSTCFKYSNKFKGASTIATYLQLNPWLVFLTPTKDFL